MHTWRQVAEAVMPSLHLTSFQLFTDKPGHAGECESTMEELKEAQKAVTELMQDGGSVIAAL